MTAGLVGRSYAPATYEVGREKIREYARAVGETDPVHLDLDAARAAGHADLVAPPMFAVVYALGALEAPLRDPELGVDYARMVHGAQELTWGPLVLAGDEITTQSSVADVSQRAGLSFFDFATRSTNQRGDLVCEGLWRMVVR